MNMNEQNDHRNPADDHRASTPAGHAAGAAPSARRRWLVAMATVCGLLLAGALGLNASIAALKLTFQKEPVPLRDDVTSIPGRLGPWVHVTLDERFPEEIEKELGTTEYIKRLYVDTRKADPAVLEKWENASVRNAELREELRISVMQNDPTAAVWLHVAYYTGSVDTVPHIPDRCMVAGGFDPVGRREETLDLHDRTMTTSFVEFEQRAGHVSPTTLSVAYFFHVNGDYEYDAITGVRKRLQDLTEKYAYFAKIECMTQSTTRDPQAARAAMGDFLHHALPAIEQVLPDWEQVNAQDAPQDAPQGAPGAD